MSQADDERRRRAERARRVGLFRYELIQEVIDPQLSARQRGKQVRELAEQAHTDPFGARVRVSRQTIDRWIRRWRAGGFEALVPTPARVSARTPAEVLEIAVALKKENPRRTAAQVVRIMYSQSGWAPSERTLQRHFVQLELDHERLAAAPPAVFGRFEADQCNELWVGDVLHGPVITGRKTYLLLTWNQTAGGIVTDRHRHHVVRGPVARERRGEVARAGPARTSRRVAWHLGQPGPCAAHHRRVCAGVGGVSAGL